jgi:hypothetical protein
MLMCINNYTVDYWQLNKIEDYGFANDELPDLELDIENLSDEDKNLLLELEKIDNNNVKINNPTYNDNNDKNRTVSRDSTICKSNTKAPNAKVSTVYYSKRVSNNGQFDKQKTSQHNSLYKTTKNDKNRSKMHLLPSKGRLSEYEFNERILLLDPFPKPDLIKKN